MLLNLRVGPSEAQVGPSGGGMYGRTDGRMEILPCVLQDFVPFGSAAQKGVELTFFGHPLSGILDFVSGQMVSGVRFRIVNLFYPRTSKSLVFVRSRRRRLGIVLRPYIRLGAPRKLSIFSLCLFAHRADSNLSHNSGKKRNETHHQPFH